MSKLPLSQRPPEETRIIVGMSGGVDSSVAAALLKQQGYQVEGLFMKNWNEDDGTEYCTAREDLLDAMQVAGALDIELHTINFASEYWDRVFEHFLEEYRAGRTPNPDILCNREIKFQAFLDHALTLGADGIATGHYAQVAHHADGRADLLRAVDHNKDQTYFLHAVGGDKFARTFFPLGHLEKPAVRQLAEQYGFDNHKKKDSTGICFIGERRFKDFLQQYLPAQPGVIEDDHGNRLGEHQGLMYYTLGQRQGLGIGGLKDADDRPWYVAAKDLSRNVLIAVQGHEHPLLQSRSLRTAPVHWINEIPPFPARLTAKTRYRQDDQPCTVTQQPDGSLQVEFDQLQRAVTPGQSLVLYDGARCLGGAVIEEHFA